MDRIEAITLVGELEDIILEYNGKFPNRLKEEVENKFKQILEAIGD